MTDSMPDSLSNSRVNLKKYLAPWVLVIIGILFNLFAALITNYFISLNHEKLAQLDERIESIDIRINTYWQDRQNIERKMEFILLLQKPDAIIVQYIENFMQQIIKQYHLTAAEYDTHGSQQVIRVIQQAQEQIVNEIDEIYFDKLILEKEKMVLVGVNSRLMSIALFMQLLGLILILAKDFQRNA